MYRFNIQTAIWLDNTVKTLKELRDDANHFSKCRFELSDNVGNGVYTNVKNAIDEAIDKINAEFEKL